MRDVITSSQLSLTPPRDYDDDIYGWDQDLDDVDHFNPNNLDYDDCDEDFDWDEDFEIEWEYEQ